MVNDPTNTTEGERRQVSQAGLTDPFRAFLPLSPVFFFFFFQANNSSFSFCRVHVAIFSRFLVPAAVDLVCTILLSQTRVPFFPGQSIEREKGWRRQEQPRNREAAGVGAARNACLCSRAGRNPQTPTLRLLRRPPRPCRVKAYLRCVCATLNFDVGEIWSFRHEEHSSDSSQGEKMIRSLR